MAVSKPKETAETFPQHEKKRKQKATNERGSSNGPQPTAQICRIKLSV